jgi:hypothetical protein
MFLKEDSPPAGRLFNVGRGSHAAEASALSLGSWFGSPTAPFVVSVQVVAAVQVEFKPMARTVCFEFDHAGEPTRRRLEVKLNSLVGVAHLAASPRGSALDLTLLLRHPPYAYHQETVDHDDGGAGDDHLIRSLLAQLSLSLSQENKRPTWTRTAGSDRFFALIATSCAVRLALKAEQSTRELLLLLSRVGLLHKDNPERLSPALPLVAAAEATPNPIPALTRAGSHSTSGELDFEMLYLVQQVCAKAFAPPSAERQLIAAALAFLRPAADGNDGTLRRRALGAALTELLLYPGTNDDERASKLSSCSLDRLAASAVDDATSSSDAELADSLVRVRRIVVSPTRVVPTGAEVETSCRVLRDFGILNDRFMRLTFLDESLAPDFRSAAEPDSLTDNGMIYARVERLLKTGVAVAGRHFEFLGYSSSQLKEKSVWPYSQAPGSLSADELRARMGDFSIGGGQMRGSHRAVLLGHRRHRPHPSAGEEALRAARARRDEP